MIIVAQLRVSGFFELATRFAIRRAHGPLVLLTAIVIDTGFFSAFLVNDATCLVMAPLVIDVTRALRRNPGPYLLAVAMASNAGSAATFTAKQTREANFAKCRSVGSQFIGDDYRRNEALPSKEFPQQLHRRGFVAVGLDQDLENLAFAVDSTPHVHLPSSD
jgi:hypothetical protein